MTEPIVLKVAADTDPTKLAGAISGQLEEQHPATLRACGAGAINQAVKALTIARGHAAPQGYDLVWSSEFLDAVFEGDLERTIIVFRPYRVRTAPQIAV